MKPLNIRIVKSMALILDPLIELMEEKPFMVLSKWFQENIKVPVDNMGTLFN